MTVSFFNLFRSDIEKIHKKAPPFGLEGTSKPRFIAFNVTHGISRPRHQGLACSTWLRANPCLDLSCSAESETSTWCPRSSFLIEMDHERLNLPGLKPNVSCYQPLWTRQSWRKIIPTSPRPQLAASNTGLLRCRWISTCLLLPPRVLAASIRQCLHLRSQE